MKLQNQIAIACLLTTICPLLASGQTLIGPTPYLSFADSPFTNLAFTYFYLENWEDHSLNTPGVTMSATNPRLSSSFGQSLIDSVDADDGVINGTSSDGAGHYGESQWANGPAGITFPFSGAVLGSLPTHVGIVWTDGFGTIEFQAFGPDGRSLGVRTGNHANSGTQGATEEDRFYGVVYPGGISAIHISNTSGGIEVDHLQYGAMPTLFVTREGTDLRLGWASRTNRMYQLQWTPVLPAAGWSNLGVAVPGTGTTNFVLDTAHPQAAKFYRLIQLP